MTGNQMAVRRARAEPRARERRPGTRLAEPARRTIQNAGTPRWALEPSATHRVQVLDINRNPRTDIFAEPLEADIFAELRQLDLQSGLNGCSDDIAAAPRARASS